MPKLWLSPIFEKDSFPAENAGNMPEIANFVDFHWTFSLSFVISFVRSFVRLLVRLFVRTFVRALVHTFIIRLVQSAFPLV